MSKILNSTMNTIGLVNFMDTSRQKKRQQNQDKLRRTRLSSFERDNSRNKYIDFTNLTKTQQMRTVKGNIKQRTSNWKYDFYRTKNCFSMIQKERIEQFPDNNKKYNIQFLQKNLKGEGLKLPIKDLGYFPKTSRSLYSKHYRPIVNEKLKYNEQYELRPSKFGDIWLDSKKQRIVDMYKLQMNPFSTQRSNDLIVLNHRIK